LNIKNFTIKLYKNIDKENWDKVVVQFDGDINYSHWMINCLCVYNKKNNIKNFSFILYETNEPIAIVPLYTEQVKGNCQISAGENALNAPLTNSKLKQKDVLVIYKYKFNYIDQLNKKHVCKLARFQFPPLSMQCINYYKLFGYDEHILQPDWYIFKCDYSYIITLKNKTISDLRSNIRNRFKSLINKTERTTNLIILDKNSCNRELFDKYARTHYDIKGYNRTREAFEEDY